MNGVLKKTVFDHGLVLISETLPYFQSVSLGVWVKVGTRNEEAHLSGICHFLEHLLFKGTQTRSAFQIAQAIDAIGGEFNAFTAREHTCFHLLLQKKDIGVGIDILSDILMHSTFQEEEIEKERQIILQEIAMVQDSPEELVHDLFFEKVYANHGLGKPILGDERSIQAMTRADVLRFFENNYCSSQLVFSVVGDLDHEFLVEAFAPLIQYFRTQPLQSKPVQLLPEPQVQSGCWWVPRPTEQVQLVWGVESLPCHSKKRFIALLLNIYLGGGMSSLLFQEIREKNALAYTVYSNLSPFIDSGIFSIYAGVSMKQIELCLDLVERCVDSLVQKGLTWDQLEATKNQLKGSILLAADSVESRMLSIARNEIFLNQALSVEDLCQQIDSVTVEAIQALAQELFQRPRDSKDSPHRSLVVLGKKPSMRLLRSLEKRYT